MKRAHRFKVPPGWVLLLRDMGVDSEAVLANAQLAADLFSRDGASLTAEEYFRLWQGLERTAGDREIPLLLAEHMSVEAFDPPLFASICSPDLNTALRRIQQYKPLIGPMEMALEVGRASTRMSISCYGNTVKLPRALELSELVFFTQLSRLTTRHRICPTRIVVSELPNNLRAYRDYFGCDLRRGRITQLSFAAEDAKRPFLTANAAMWDYFEAGLNKRLALVGADSSTTERLRAVLVELLPAGISSIEHAADKMAVSKRTLQRKLTAESATYHDVLQSVREELADHYLSRSGLPLGEIAFLLGYSETNSFIRAFSAWKGVAPGNYRESLH